MDNFPDSARSVNTLLVHTTRLNGPQLATSVYLKCGGDSCATALTRQSGIHTILAHITRRNGSITRLMEAVRCVVAAFVQHPAHYVIIGNFRLCMNCCILVSVRSHSGDSEIFEAARDSRRVLHIVPRITYQLETRSFTTESLKHVGKDLLVVLYYHQNTVLLTTEHSPSSSNCAAYALI